MAVHAFGSVHRGSITEKGGKKRLSLYAILVVMQMTISWRMHKYMLVLRARRMARGRIVRAAERDLYDRVLPRISEGFPSLVSGLGVELT